MSVFGKLAAASLDVLVTPVEIVKDVVTLGGAVLGHNETYTGKRLREAGEHFQAAIDELAD